MSSTLPTINETKSSQNPKSTRKGFLKAKTVDFLLDWLVFPALLLVQFIATMVCHARAGILEVNATGCLLAIVFFCVVAGLYRRVLRNHPSESVMLLLLPEIFTNILLGLVMFGTLHQAIEVMLAFTASMVAVGGVASVHAKIVLRSIIPENYKPLPSSDKEEDEDEEEDEWVC